MSVRSDFKNLDSFTLKTSKNYIIRNFLCYGRMRVNLSVLCRKHSYPDFKNRISRVYAELQWSNTNIIIKLINREDFSPWECRHHFRTGFFDQIWKFRFLQYFTFQYDYPICLKLSDLKANLSVRGVAFLFAWPKTTKTSQLVLMVRNKPKVGLGLF